MIPTRCILAYVKLTQHSHQQEKKECKSFEHVCITWTTPASRLCFVRQCDNHDDTTLHDEDYVFHAQIPLDLTSLHSLPFPPFA